MHCATENTEGVNQSLDIHFSKLLNSFYFHLLQYCFRLWSYARKFSHAKFRNEPFDIFWSDNRGSVGFLVVRCQFCYQLVRSYAYRTGHFFLVQYIFLDSLGQLSSFFIATNLAGDIKKSLVNADLLEFFSILSGDRHYTIRDLAV